jgi:hypothetical protein
MDSFLLKVLVVLSLKLTINFESNNSGNITHSKEFAGNQRKHQNSVPSILTHNL